MRQMREGDWERIQRKFCREKAQRAQRGRAVGGRGKAVEGHRTPGRWRVLRGRLNGWDEGSGARRWRRGSGRSAAFMPLQRSSKQSARNFFTVSVHLVIEAA